MMLVATPVPYRTHVNRLALLVALGWFVTPGAAHASIDSSMVADAVVGELACFKAGETVEVTGKLVQKTFPGPPGFGESPTDKPVTGYYLELATPICTEEDEFDAAKSAVSLVQLVVGKNARYTPFLGQRITMRGTWYHAHTGYHNAEVVLEPVGQPRVERR